MDASDSKQKKVSSSLYSSIAKRGVLTTISSGLSRKDMQKQRIPQFVSLLQKSLQTKRLHSPPIFHNEIRNYANPREHYREWAQARHTFAARPIIFKSQLESQKDIETPTTIKLDCRLNLNVAKYSNFDNFLYTQDILL